MNVQAGGAASRNWLPGPADPSLAPGALHVWQADLSALPDELGALLDADERERAARMLRERDWRLWARGHGLLRLLLASYLRIEPGTLRFTAGPHGKPALDCAARGAGAEAHEASPPGADAGTGALSFNLSHSGQTALYAFSKDGPVGVDVELARRGIDALAIAERAFGAAEARRLAALDPDAREREFLRAWVRHEAELKCLGAGLAGAGAPADGGPLWVAQLDLGPRAAGAVATLRRPTTLSCWDWGSSPAGAGGRETAG
jgi:4'-phosphopantetheinyl transferase